MTAEAPADEIRVAEPERLDDCANGARVAGKRIGSRVCRVIGGATTWEIDGNQSKTLAERPIKLAQESA